MKHYINKLIRTAFMFNFTIVNKIMRPFEIFCTTFLVSTIFACTSPNVLAPEERAFNGAWVNPPMKRIE